MRDDAREALKLARGKSRADFDDEMFAYAMTFIAGRIDVTAAKVPSELRDACPGVPWDDVIGVRERILAGEGYRNDALVWETPGVLPELPAALEGGMEDLETTEDRY